MQTGVVKQLFQAIINLSKFIATSDCFKRFDMTAPIFMSHFTPGYEACLRHFSPSHTVPAFHHYILKASWDYICLAEKYINT